MYHKKFNTAELEKKADLVMENFNFDKVHQHMVATDWKWIGPKEMSVPTVEDLRSTARSLLTEAIWSESETTNIGTGGFVALKLDWGLMLVFSIETSNSF